MLQSNNSSGHLPNDFPCDCSCLVVRRAIGFGFRVRRAAFTGFGFRVFVVSGLHSTQDDLKFKEVITAAPARFVHKPDLDHANEILDQPCRGSRDYFFFRNNAKCNCTVDSH